MKKIVLIEDVVSRQKDFLKEADLDLLEFNDILYNAVGDHYKAIDASLVNDELNFDDYAVIMAHQSAFGKDVKNSLEKLKKYCGETGTSLVLFSGGASNYYDNVKYEHLELNTKDFYSQNLAIFLKAYREGKHNILMLAYGEKWILNTLLNVLERTNNFLDKNSENDIVYKGYENYTEFNKLDSLKHNFYDLPIDEDDWVEPKDLVLLRDSIAAYIREFTNA